ncbi:THAP domain-containing protein 2-like [Hydractinia symbiolongicarpus]|uniref:THAP domain-containing protein 2-like n=1 Tax=Hydractinia symbiolongicarpus TaxID=13093 RepID=UPI00254A5677|nr:THAP domain-containing protein 2-like [Hydractinia symbiolongicarpus]
MAWCAAVGCTNHTANNPEKVQFFKLPSNEDTRKKWIHALRRKNLPKRVFVCLKHFEEKCFDPSWDMQHQIFPRKIPRMLLKNAFPTIFCFQEQPKERKASVRRAQCREREEVMETAVVMELHEE